MHTENVVTRSPFNQPHCHALPPTAPLQVNSPKSPKQPKSPRSPRSPNSPKGRLMGRLSPRRRPQSPAAAAAAPPTA